ncbi:uncharacterized protein [Macrobrachium rosenbergii]|uniref:uncharacterized protein n=1 Tax=Macrobrachium rosenbergii TaxID=79674 RepID=UPI0034D539C5
MGYRCKKCKQCERCEDGDDDERCTCRCNEKWCCTCKCNVGSESDVIQKVGAIGLGTAAAIGGIGLTVLTGGLALPLVGGVVAGAGISSAINGTVKSVKGEKISGSEYLTDVAIGGATGVIGGVGGKITEGVARAAVTNVARETCKRGVIKLGVRAAGGAATGLASTAMGEVGNCVKGKKWTDYGNDPESWGIGMALGIGGGTVSHITSNTSKLVPHQEDKELVKFLHKSAWSAQKASVSIDKKLRKK